MDSSNSQVAPPGSEPHQEKALLAGSSDSEDTPQSHCGSLRGDSLSPEGTPEAELSCRALEVDHEYVRLANMDAEWAQHFVPASPGWDMATRMPGVHLVGKSCDGQTWEVAVKDGIAPFLHQLGYSCDFKSNRYDVVEPDDGETRVYGIVEAKQRARRRYVESATRGILTQPGLDRYYRNHVKPELKSQIQRLLGNGDSRVVDPDDTGDVDTTEVD